MASKAYRARYNLGSGFRKYFEKYTPGQTRSSAFTLLRHTINTKYNLTPWNAARLEIGILLGFLANTLPTIFYVLVHLYNDPKLLRQVRSELESKCVETSLDGTKRILQVLTMQRHCSLLQATFKEVLRHHALGSSVRYVREDMLLDGKYLLKEGMVVQVPMAVLHRDRSAWGEDFQCFRPTRFLKSADGPDTDLKPNPSAFRPFGGGTSLCPGRHLATLQITALTALMVLRFDMEPVDGSWIVPPSRQDSMATNVFPPEHDIHVRLISRQASAAEEWTFNMR